MDMRRLRRKTEVTKYRKIQDNVLKLETGKNDSNAASDTAQGEIIQGVN